MTVSNLPQGEVKADMNNVVKTAGLHGNMQTNTSEDTTTSAHIAKQALEDFMMLPFIVSYSDYIDIITNQRDYGH